METAVISAKYRTLDKIFLEIEEILSDNGKMSLGSGRREVTITDYGDRIKAVRELIRQYDIPPRRIEVIVKLIEASKSKNKASEISNEIRDIGSRLSNVLRFTDYKLLDTAVVEGVEGKSSSVNLAGSYTVRYDLDFINDGTGVIKMENFNLSKLAGSEKNSSRCNSLITTSMNILNGEEIICGASKMEAEGDKSLILVISVRTVDK